MLSFVVQAGNKSHVRPIGVIDMIFDFHLGPGDTYPHAPTATSRTRSCTILVIWETDRWSALKQSTTSQEVHVDE